MMLGSVLLLCAMILQVHGFLPTNKPLWRPTKQVTSSPVSINIPVFKQFSNDLSLHSAVEEKEKEQTAFEKVASTGNRPFSSLMLSFNRNITQLGLAGVLAIAVAEVRFSS